MAYNEILGDRVREILSLHDNVIEKKMFGGLCFMLNDKMCVGIMKEKLMCRVDPQDIDSLLEKAGCSMMDFTGKPMKGFVLVDDTEIESHKDLKFWVDLCVSYNPLAQSSKKRS